MEYSSESNRARNFKIDFEITNAISSRIVGHEVQLLINRSYYKIQEEYDSGINYLTGSKLDAEKITHSIATSARLMKRTVQL